MTSQAPLQAATFISGPGTVNIAQAQAASGLGAGAAPAGCRFQVAGFCADTLMGMLAVMAGGVMAVIALVVALA